MEALKAAEEGRPLARRAVFCNARKRTAATIRGAGKLFPGVVLENLPPGTWVPREGAPGHGKGPRGARGKA